MISEAKKYHSYARECLRLAETADRPEIRERLIELSHVWIEAALREEMLTTTSQATVGSSKT
jgi:hypothetical protein